MFLYVYSTEGFKTYSEIFVYYFYSQRILPANKNDALADDEGINIISKSLTLVDKFQKRVKVPNTLTEYLQKNMQVYQNYSLFVENYFFFNSDDTNLERTN